MDILEVDRLIKSLVKNEDAAQDVWVKILDANVTDVDDIKKLASKRRVGTYEYLLRDINNKGYRSDKSYSIFDKYASGKPYISKLSPRCTDVKCIYCGSSQIYQYGFYKSNRRYWCRECSRKFRNTSYAPYKQVPQSILETAQMLLNDGKTFRQIANELKCSTASAFRWATGRKRSLRLDYESQP